MKVLEVGTILIHPASGKWKITNISVRQNPINNQWDTYFTLNKDNEEQPIEASFKEILNPTYGFKL